MADVVALLDEVRAIARTGLHYAENPFDRARYERLLEIAAQGYADVTGLESDVVRARFLAEIGYATAKVGADGAVFDDDDRVLLVRRADDGKWGLVAGWVDPNEAPEETIVREFAEELGVVGRVEQLVGTCFRPANAGYGPARVRLGRLPLLDREPRLPLPGPRGAGGGLASPRRGHRLASQPRTARATRVRRLVARHRPLAPLTSVATTPRRSRPRRPGDRSTPTTTRSRRWRAGARSAGRRSALRTPRTWVGAASRRRFHPSSVSTAYEPRRSSGHCRRSTSPCRTMPSTRRVMPLGERCSVSASSCIRRPPSPALRDDREDLVLGEREAVLAAGAPGRGWRGGPWSSGSGRARPASPSR